MNLIPAMEQPFFQIGDHRLGAQFSRYVVVGGVAFVVDFAFLYLLTEFAGLYYLFAACLAFMAGLAVNYGLSVSWVFMHRSVANRLHEFVIFTVVGILGLVFNATLIWLFTEMAGIHYLESKIIATAMIFLFNFGARKMLLFSNSRPAKRVDSTWVIRHGGNL